MESKRKGAQLQIGYGGDYTSQVPQPTQEVGWGFNALKSWKFFFRAFQNRQLAMYRAGW